MSRVSQRADFLSVVLIGLLVGGLLAGGVGAGDAAASVQSGDSQTSTLGGTTANASTNTTTPPHQNPDTVSEDGDPEQVADYLSAQLSGYLGDSSLNLSNAQYDQARSILGDNYNDTLQQYVDVTDDTEGNTTEQFREVRDETQELITLREEYDQMLAEYEAAVAAGNTSRARELARELATLAEQIDGVTARLDERLATIENATGRDLDARETVQSISETTSESATAVTNTQLTETTIQAQLNRTTLSFGSPGRLTGRLQTANGTPISNATVSLEVGARRYTATTTATGEFTVVYRPVFVPLNATTIPVRYLPTGNSPYLSSNTTVAGSITEQTPATIAVNTDRLSTQYGDTFSITGTAVVGGNATVADLPVTVSLAGRQLGSADTHKNGSFTLRGTIPSPTIEPGQRQLEVAVPLANRSVAGSSTALSVDVLPAATTLSLNATATEATNTSVSLSGALSLTSGAPLEGRSLDVFVNGAQVASVETTPRGSYTTTLRTAVADAPPESTITVRFDGRGTNLAPSEAATTVIFSPDTASQSGVFSILREQPLLIGGGIAVALSLLTLLVATQIERPGGTSHPAPATTDTEQSTSGSTAVSDADTRARTLATAAEDALAAGNPTTAVQIAYSSLRAALTAESGAGTDETHWEFYKRCQTENIEPISTLKEVTAVYETATFAPTSVSQQKAKAIVTAVSDVIRSEE